MRATAFVWTLLCLTVSACQEPTPEPPVEVDLGLHRASFRVPDGWLHMDHGIVQRFEKQLASITLADLGPATPDGFAELLRNARDLFERNQWEDARAVLDTVDPERFFANHERWDAVETDWRTIRRIRRDHDAGDSSGVHADVEWAVQGAFHDLLVQVSTLREPSFESLAMNALHSVGHDELRDIAAQESFAISGQPALRIDTWDRLSHNARQSHLFILSGDRLLCLRTGLGSWPELETAFDTLMTTLSIAANQGRDGE